MVDPKKPISPMPPPLVTKKEVSSVIVEEDEKVKAKREVLNKIQAVLKEYEGMESNIPPSHDYWKLLGQYRGM